ncbi:hypothetical protein ACHAXR_005075, partial [Thalassiosira sp. AJA248-18]
MSIYGVGLMPLASRMRTAIPDALQPWFADDAAGAGKAINNARCLNFLMEHGPKYGYFPEPDKCWYICKAEDEEVAKGAFQQFGLNINYTRGKRYLGGFIGSAETKNQWLGGMVSKWVQAVQTFAQLAPRYPQTVYCGFTFCLQNEWQYVQRVVADTAPFFAPLEAVIRKEFIPALLGMPSWEMDGEFRALIANGVKSGGLAIRNPVDTAEHVHKASMEATAHLTTSLVDNSVEFDFRTHREVAGEAIARARNLRKGRELTVLAERGDGAPAVKRRDERNSRNGAWITIIPSRLNGTDLSADEFLDNMRLRYNKKPLEMPQHCDGCSASMTVEHALSCKVGG